MKKDTKRAFQWIINILKKQKIPFQISGGFAARLYGANRPLYDIDIEVPDKYFQFLLPLVKDHIIYGPKRYHDKEFDVLLMTLKYKGQEIDISGCETDKLFNKETKLWESCGTNLENSVYYKVYGTKIPVISKEDLLAYKKKIKRPVDSKDIAALNRKSSSKRR